MKGRMRGANKSVQDLNYKYFNNFFVVPPQNLSRTSANRSRIRFANMTGSLFNNDLMHNSTEKNTNYNYFISVLKGQ